MVSFCINRRTLGTAMALAVASAAVPVLRAQSKPEKTRVSIAVGGKAALYYVPLSIAAQLGYLLWKWRHERAERNAKRDAYGAEP